MSLMVRWALSLLVVALLLSCASGPPPAPPVDPLAGSWDGDDWGGVGIREDLTGTYAGTFEGSTGDLRLTAEGDGRYRGTWTERVATEGHPLRKGDLTLHLQGSEVHVSWEATDQNPKRQARGTSTWKRTDSPR